MGSAGDAARAAVRTPQGDRWFIYSPLAGGDPKALAAVRFASQAAAQGGGVTYEAVIPWAWLPGIAPAAGTQFRFSLLVNENDGKGRRGWRSCVARLWGSGSGRVPCYACLPLSIP